MSNYNEEKLSKLLNKKEIVILKLSEIEKDNEKFRVDSEFFQKKYLTTYSFIKNERAGIQLGSVIKVLTDFSANGSYKSIADNFTLLDEPNYAYMVRTTDLEKQDFVNDVKYVSKESYDFLAKSKVYGGELLINKIGSPGKTYMMPHLNKPVSLGMNLFMLTLKPDVGFDEYFLWAYFNSEHGKNMIFRKVNGTVPQTIDKEAIRSLYVPVIDGKVCELVSHAVKLHEEYVKAYTELFNQVTSKLYETIGFDKSRLSSNNISICKLSDSFGVSGRLDSEYYLPKYNQLASFIKKGNHDKLGNLVDIKKSHEPGSNFYVYEDGTPFVRVAEVSEFDVAEPELRIDSSYDFSQNPIPSKGSILLTKDGTIGVAHFLSEQPCFVTSSGVLQLKVLDCERILPQFLTAILNSDIVRMQCERDAGGSIISHWTVPEINEILIPIPDMPVQKDICSIYSKADEIVKKSKAVSKVAVETINIALDKGDSEALDYIEKEIVNFEM
ncbi:MAG: restriction endonuclease subunit S [Bacilli bacterium]|nr:restriction endonuclease subunit S [Bacilli bacterium]